MLARIGEIEALVAQIAGMAPGDDAALDRAARISSAYDVALPIERKRFDQLVTATSGWALTAVEALLAAGSQASPAAAGQLARDLRGTRRQLERSVGLR